MEQATIQSQVKQILNYLQNGGKLTGIDALNKFGCFRLSARIHDIRAMGNSVQSRKVTRAGKRFAEYYIEEEK
jgi:hypothetical protein